MYETDNENSEHVIDADPSLAVAVTLAELELLRAEAAIAQLDIPSPGEFAIHDLSPLGQRRL
jgi:hypothetical protein